MEGVCAKVSSRGKSLHRSLGPQENTVLKNEKDGQKEKTVAIQQGMVCDAQRGWRGPDLGRRGQTGYSRRTEEAKLGVLKGKYDLENSWVGTHAPQQCQKTKVLHLGPQRS